jgi:hypothetical protein
MAACDKPFREIARRIEVSKASIVECSTDRQSSVRNAQDRFTKEIEICVDRLTREFTTKFLNPKSRKYGKIAPIVKKRLIKVRDLKDI